MILNLIRIPAVKRGDHLFIFAFLVNFWYLNFMPITRSAKKAIRVSSRKKGYNDRHKKAMKEVIKKLAKLAKTDKKEAEKILSSAYQIIDKAAKRGVIKKNNASRKKSRLSKLVK